MCIRDSDGSIDLIYLDPPFNSKRNYGEFDDRWSGDGEYIDFMTARLVQCHRLLANTGSIYLHCDPTMSHYLKVVMDTIWGRSNFRNEIVWKRSSRSDGGQFGRVHDVILYYTKSGERVWNDQYVPLDPNYVKKSYQYDGPLSDKFGPVSSVCLLYTSPSPRDS